MIDLQHAKEAFERYLDGYDRENYEETIAKSTQNSRYKQIYK